MSNFSTQARRPGGDWEKVMMLDDFFGSHRYGVCFPDGKIFPERECQFKNDTPSDLPEFFKDIFNPKK